MFVRTPRPVPARKFELTVILVAMIAPLRLRLRRRRRRSLTQDGEMTEEFLVQPEAAIEVLERLGFTVEPDQRVGALVDLLDLVGQPSPAPAFHLLDRTTRSGDQIADGLDLGLDVLLFDGWMQNEDSLVLAQGRSLLSGPVLAPPVRRRQQPAGSQPASAAPVPRRDGDGTAPDREP